MRRHSGSHPGDGRRHSRSRSRRGRQSSRGPPDAHPQTRPRGPQDGRQQNRNRGPSNASQQNPPAAATDVIKSGQQKAKEAMEKEKEKARLKKLERDKALQEKQASKELAKTQKREAIQSVIENTEEDANPTSLSTGTGQVSQEADAKAEAFRNAKGSSELPPRSAATTTPEEEIRKLFGLLDRNDKGQVSQRDVLVALKKHPAVRRLLRLPVSHTEEGGEKMEARLLAIQDAFESGTGLGELAPIVDKLRGESSTFGWEAFLASVQTMSARVVAAAAALLPREHSTGSVFNATQAWQEVPDGAACPGGLEYKMAMNTGKTLARLMPTKPARTESSVPVTTRTLATYEGTN